MVLKSDTLQENLLKNDTLLENLLKNDTLLENLLKNDTLYSEGTHVEAHYCHHYSCAVRCPMSDVDTIFKSPLLPQFQSDLLQTFTESFLGGPSQKDMPHFGIF